MTTEQFKEGLVAGEAPHGVHVYHIQKAPDQECPVLCWQELGHTTVFGDDKPIARIQRMQLDYFTETEYDDHYKVIEQILRNMDCAFTHEGMTFDGERCQWRDIWTTQFLEAV